MKINISKILCPVDFSESSMHALDYAAAFARAHNAELLLLHVTQPLVYGIVEDPGGLNLYQGLEESMQQAAQSKLEEVEKNSREAGLEVKTMLILGTPFLEIIGVAKEKTVDLIVLGTHGRSGLSHVLMGSVAERVVRKAPCPVLTVKHPEHEFVMP